jgi:hypothetical protein
MSTITVDQIMTYREWWPASVLLPGRTQSDRRPVHRVRAYATSAGLLVYEHRPTLATPEFGAVTPDWHSPIDFTATAAPMLSKLPGASVDIHTEAGLVVITYTGGCGCGHPLRHWRPSFSTRVAAWPA